MPYYAQLSQSRIVAAVTQTSAPLEPDPLLIEIDGLNNELLGRLHNLQTGQFEEVVDATPTPRRISVGAFFDRFGPLKWEILADTAPTVQAVVRDSSVRKFIDLDNSDLPAGLQIIVTAGHAINPASIINAAIAPEELP